MLKIATQCELQRYENNYKPLNLITTALGRNVYDHISHIETAHYVWLKLYNTYEDSSENKSSRKDTYNRQYQTFSQNLEESLDNCFCRFESIVSNLRSCDPLAYTNNECAKQLFYALDDHEWAIKITALEKSTDFATFDTEKLFSKLKSHELSHQDLPNHDVSFTRKALITSACVGGHDANPTNVVSSGLKFVLSSMVAASDEQYKSIPDDEIFLLARKFRALHKFCKEKRRSPRGCFECGDITHFIADCPKRKKLDSSNKYDYTNRNDYNNKDDNNKKNRFRDNNNKKKFQKIMSRACAALSNFNFSSEDSSSSEEDEKIKCKKGNFTGLCLIGKSLQNDSDFDSDVSDDLSFKSLSFKVVELENALCNQDKLLCKVFHENRKLNLELKNSFAEIASLRSMHNDMSAKPCENYNMITVNYVNLWIVHTQVASQLKGVPSCNSMSSKCVPCC
jgi:hypothetical protein